MSIQPQDKRRYSLVVAEDLFKELEELATEKDTSVVDLIRKFIKLGLMVSKTENTPDTAFLIQEGDTVRRVLIL